MTTTKLRETRLEGQKEPTAARLLHRGFFTAVGLLPSRLATRVRVACFNARFAAGTPWPYDNCNYEAAKRDALAAATPHDAQVIVEVGTANGHNLSHLAQHAPTARVIGLDISHHACQLARQRHANDPRIEVHLADLPTAATQLPELRRSVDLVVLSEILYYLGGKQAMTTQLAPARNLLTAKGRVVLAHGCPDAEDLHRRAAHCLDLPVLRERRTIAGHRTFLISELGAR